MNLLIDYSFLSTSCFFFLIFLGGALTSLDSWRAWESSKALLSLNFDCFFELFLDLESESDSEEEEELDDVDVDEDLDFDLEEEDEEEETLDTL